MPRVFVMIKALALVLFAACAHHADAALSKSCQAQDANLDTRFIDCGERNYACNIADLTASGKANENTRADGGPCTLTIDNYSYGLFPRKSYTRCRLETSGTVTTTLGVSATGPSAAVSVANGKTYEYKNNCAAWCGTSTYSPSLADKLYTFVRCYDSKTCKNSKCLKKGLISRKWWY